MTEDTTKSKYDQVLPHIIEGHRRLIHSRYDYHRLAQSYDIPEFFKVEEANQLKAFFMEQIYPPLEKRSELNEAFAHLDSFIQSPNKFFALIKDSLRLVIKHGQHLPKIINAALKAMKSYRSAIRIEDHLTRIAINKNMTTPLDIHAMKNLMSELPDQMLQNHQESIWPLYDIITDRNLVNKILEVVNYLLHRMKDRRNVYSEAEIMGVALGRDLIYEANALFQNYTNDQLKEIMELITKVERNNYKEFMSDRPS